MSDNPADKQKPSGSAKMADEAVVPQVNSHITASMLPPVPYGGHQMMPPGMASLFDQFTGVKTNSLNYDQVAMMPNQASMGFPQIAMLPSGVVPQLSQQLAAKRLTQAQQSELEMARRRAQKAAEGKRANATAARRAKRKALGQTPKVEVPSGPVQQTKDSDDEKDDLNQTDEDLEARLAVTTNEKETKRLKRLLRNRVSAQQARERKKTFVANLEAKNKLQEQQMLAMQEQVKKLERDNMMLRQVIKNMKSGCDTGMV